MKKILRKMASSLLLLLPLFGCKTEELKCPGSQGQSPATMREVRFDGKFVQNYRIDWLIAFDFYDIEDSWLIINGRFMIPENFEFGDIEQLESSFDPFVIVGSYNPDPTIYDQDSVTSNFENNRWDLISIDEDNCCSFILNIDISPLIERDKKLGKLQMGDPFEVVCFFGGAPIC